MNQRRNSPASRMALGGVLAALAVVIMSLGGLIPIATYVSPMLCAVLLQVVLLSCSHRVAWAWYGAVAILAVLLSPDKEAAAVYVFLGYYPIVKPRLDHTRPAWLWKGLLFNVSIGVMYFLLLKIFGMTQLGEEFTEFGLGMLAVLLFMGNITFFLLDRLLGMRLRRRKVF